MSTAPTPLLLASRQAAATMGVSERTLWAISAPRGDLPVVRVGTGRGRMMYAVADLENWINHHRQTREGE